MRRYLLALALSLLLAADLGWKAWSERPYIVTGYGISTLGQNRAFYVEYRLPGGGTGKWHQDASLDVVAYCYYTARIGSTIPACMRSYNEAFKARVDDEGGG